MLSAAAQAFAAAPRTPESFRTFVSEDAPAASAWLSRYASTAGVSSPALKALNELQASTFETKAAKTTALEAFFIDNGALAEMVDLANLQAARAHTLGFTVIEPAAKQKPAFLTGIARMDSGVLQLEVGGKRYAVDSPNWQASLQLAYFEANALGAFDGKEVTVKAYPVNDTTLAVEEFSPGIGTDFLSGRLAVRGELLGVNVSPTKWVELKDPELVRRLKPLNTLGIVLPGKVKSEGDTHVFEGAPTDYWMLAANAQFGATPTPGIVALAHGQTRSFKGDISTEKPTRRVLIYGHLEADAATLVAHKALAAPEVKHEHGLAFQPTTVSLAALTPVELPEAEPVGFAA